MFSHLRTKLTVLYAALFGVGAVLVSVAVYTAISSNAASMVRDELAASGTVFDRLWALRERQLQDGAAVLSRDFGFREAMATRDAATVESALANLRARLGLDLALIVGLDGQLTNSDGRSLGPAAEDLRRGAETETGPTGVLVVGGVPYQTAAAPILTPTLTGWVVFGVKLDEAEMQALEKLSAIPIEAEVLDRRGDRWTSAAGVAEPAVARLIDEVRTASGAAVRDLSAREGPAITLVKPLAAMREGAPAVLLLRYPTARAMAPYRPLLNLIVLIGVLGIVAVVTGSFFIAKSVTQPVSALDEAARRLQRGEDANVPVTSRDELGRLAETFNRMSAGIRDRERRIRADAETLAVALERAEAANRLTNEFLANMSHEIRTPLNGVLGLTQVLATTAKEPAQRELTGAILESAGALERLLCDILETAQLKAGAAELASAPFSLGDAVREACAPYEAVAGAKQLSFALELPPEAEARVSGDVARVQRVLAALVDNAVKFTDAGGVAVRVCAAGDRFRFTVTDTGQGFDPADKARLFAPFQQADGSATRRHGGSGLGLSVARGVAQLMGGELDGDPLPGGGSSFWFELPLPPAPEPRRAEAAA